MFLSLRHQICNSWLRHATTIWWRTMWPLLDIYFYCPIVPFCFMWKKSISVNISCNTNLSTTIKGLFILVWCGIAFALEPQSQSQLNGLCNPFYNVMSHIAHKKCLLQSHIHTTHCNVIKKRSLTSHRVNDTLSSLEWRLTETVNFWR